MAPVVTTKFHPLAATLIELQGAVEQLTSRFQLALLELDEPTQVHRIGKSVIVAAHGNSLRALVMALEGLSPEKILKREIATGVPIIYKLNANGTIASSKVLEH